MEKLFSLEEVAEILGVPLDDLMDVVKNEGLIDENGNPSQKAIDDGLLTVDKSELN